MNYVEFGKKKVRPIGDPIATLSFYILVFRQ